MKKLLTVLFLTIICGCDVKRPPDGWENQLINKWSQSLFNKTPEGIYCSSLSWDTKKCDINVNDKVYSLICHYHDAPTFDDNSNNCILQIK
jgi:hypothetical protein